MKGPGSTLVALLLTCGCHGCSPEQRPLSPALPLTPPQADASEDLRVPHYQQNRFQVSQGARYFIWYGCAGCHVDGAPQELDLADHRWKHGDAFADVYRFIARGHAGIAPYGDTIPVEQLWQITAYVRSLPEQDAAMRRRQALDLAGEPRGSAWAGALR